MNPEINYIAVLVAAVVSMVVGFVYYHPMVVGKAWMKEKGLTPEKLKTEQAQMAKFYALSFVLAIITAYILAHVFAFSKNFYNYDDVQTGLTTAFFIWVGFVMPVQASDQIFGDKNFKLLAINTIYQLIALLGMGLVIAWF